MYLETKHAQAIADMLEDAQDIGYTYVVFEQHMMDRQLNTGDLNFFDTYGAAMDHWERLADQRYLPGPDEWPVYCMPVDQLLYELKEQNLLTIDQVEMNRNNLQNIQEEMNKLGFSKKSIEDAEKKMEKGLPDFTVYEQLRGTKGQVDVTAHFRQSNQSDNFYLNKFDVALNTGKPLEEGQRYFVVSPNPQEPGKNLSKGFDSVTEAIGFFKEQQGDSRLGVGKGPANISELATMKNGKVDYVDKDFQRTFRIPAQTQTVFVERGKGFTVEQAANLIQGRSVYRDDLLNLGGQPYSAWVKLDFDSPKDRYQNYVTNQYHVPSYAVTASESLDKFKIKELEDPKKLEALVKSIENGNRPLVTVTKDGQETKLFLEASPRYHQMNFFREDGKPEKREQFLKEPAKDQSLQVNKAQGKDKQQAQGMAV